MTTLLPPQFYIVSSKLTNCDNHQSTTTILGLGSSFDRALKLAHIEALELAYQTFGNMSKYPDYDFTCKHLCECECECQNKCYCQLMCDNVCKCEYNYSPKCQCQYYCDDDCDDDHECQCKCFCYLDAIITRVDISENHTTKLPQIVFKVGNFDWYEISIYKVPIKNTNL